MVTTRTGRRNSKSGIRGVSWHKPMGKWVVTVKVGGKTTFGGYFADVCEARRAEIALREKVGARQWDHCTTATCTRPGTR